MQWGCWETKKTWHGLIIVESFQLVQNKKSGTTMPCVVVLKKNVVDYDKKDTRKN